MSISDRRWQIYPEHRSLAEKIALKLRKSPLLAQVLLNRKLHSLEDMLFFIGQIFTDSSEPSHTMMHPDMDRLTEAAQLVHGHIQKQSKILIYGDYDVDGVTSTTLLTWALREVGATVDYHIPHRFTEGYGLSTKILDKLKQNQYGLLITLDCGISNELEIRTFKEALPIDVLIMDHHTIPDVLPPADAIINPKFLSPDHPNYHLCSAGIAYQFMAFYRHYYKLDFPLEDHLDLVALGTIADVAPLTGNNRLLTQKGLDILSRKGRAGLFELLDIAGHKKEAVSVRDVGFTIAPRLNAAGRLEHGKIGVELLLASDTRLCRDLAWQLQKTNEKRQLICATILDDAVAKAEAEFDPETDKILVLSGNNWHAGVIGITASQLVRKWARPVVLIAHDGQHGRGSARSVGGVNIYRYLKQASHLLEEFGGHKEAAGFSILADRISEFKTVLRGLCNDQITIEELLPVLEIDAKVAATELTLELAQELAALEPFGSANPTPIFYTDELRAVDFKTVGNGNHLKMTLTDAKNKVAIDAIGFDLSSKIELLYKDHLELAFNLDINQWLGKESLQLQILDIK